MVNKLDHALALAASGFKVFPITPGAKAPPLVTHWPERATTDASAIREWWGTVPDANIGIHASGMIVLDVDTKKEGPRALALLRLTDGLPDTLETTTPSGGQHLFFRLPDGHAGCPNGVDVLGPGLDVRSVGGYVVAPGSTVPAGVYAWRNPGAEITLAPDWLVQKLGTFTRRERQEESNIVDAPKEAIDRAREWLRSAERSVKGAGGDQTAYRVACALRDMGLSYVQACEEMRGEAWDYGCGWREGRLEEKPIRSAYKYAQNEPGVKLVTASQFTAIPSNPQIGGGKPKEQARVQRAEALADEPLSYDYIIKNWLERATYALMFGESGEGKTFTALDFGFHVATGREWRGNKVRRGHVLYLAFEGKGGIKRRVRALRKQYGSLGDLWIAGVSMNLRETAGRQELGTLLADLPQKPALIVIDTFARALMGGDENSAQDTGAFNNAVEALIDATGACVLVIHHSGKNKAAGARGSSAIRAALDTELEIENKQIISRKQRDAENPLALGFKLRPVEIGMDSDGQLMTSCVVEPSNEIATGTRRTLTGKGEHAFAVLSEMSGAENAPVLRTRYVARLQDEGFGRSVAHEWVRKLERLGKVTVENGEISRRLA